MVEKQPKKIIDFEYSVSAVIPLWDNAGRPISSEKISKITKYFSEKFGGATVFPTYGCWFDDKKKKLVCEQNLVIKSLVDTGKPRESMTEAEIEEHLKGTLNDVVNFLHKHVGEDLKQAAVLIEADPEDMGVLFSGSEPGPVREALVEKVSQPDLRTFLKKFRF